MRADDAFVLLAKQWRLGEGDTNFDLPSLHIDMLVYIKYLHGNKKGTVQGTGTEEIVSLGNSFESVRQFQNACTFIYSKIKRDSPFDRPGAL